MQLGRTTLVVTFGIVAALFLVSNLVLGIGPNFGWSVGYYGKLNRVLDELEQMPGVTITHIGTHEDVRLEDFEITVEISGEQQTIYFDNASSRSLEDLKSEIAEVL